MNRGNPPSSAAPSGRRRRGVPPSAAGEGKPPERRRGPHPGGKGKGGRRHRGPLRVAAGIIRDRDRILITQRKAEDSLGGFWEFPGGKLEQGEGYPAALKRELMEEIGVEVVVGGLFATIRHKYPGGEVKLCFLEARIVRGEVQAIDVAAWKWVLPSELGNFRFPPADEPLIKKLQSAPPKSQQTGPI
ncbi:mutator mutT protein [Verrucomicrobium sp. GAS474]|uniref:8-oxo-dGTP diphosphatase MutT n=1 Tax=Verrucomicrobium sp. GAS474 TaxID=1882831 RepID=UPI00087CE5D0|nr:8-oxo-dGTP diphosphatase MutT [Verrucomicrobium sp. GAS474]SDU20334.1 mutator mutT protein [Verrucomicrobium sp. GAS474]